MSSFVVVDKNSYIPFQKDYINFTVQPAINTYEFPRHLNNIGLYIFSFFFFFTSEMDCFHINSVFLSVNPVSILFAYLGDILM